MHSDFFHYVFILGGNARVLVNNEIKYINENCLYMTAPGENHNFTAVSPTGLFTIEFKFSMKASDYEKKLLSVPDRLYDCPPQVRNLINGIITEGINKKPYYESIANLRLCELILILLREFTNESDYSEYEKGTDNSFESAPVDEDEIKKDNKTTFTKLILYMHENVGKQITLDHMAAYVNISKGHLIELFKREFGMTPVKYLNKIRISRSKELLKASSLNINEIAEQTGFVDSRYFSRVFKKFEDITPSEYLEKYRNNLYIFLHGQDGF